VVKGLFRLLDRIEGSLAAAAAIILVAVTLSVCVDVLMRTLFNSPIVWVVEIDEYALLYITFLGTAWTLRQGSHVRVDILIGLLPPGGRRILGMISSLLGIIVSVVLTAWGTMVTWDKFVTAAYKPTVINFPTWIVVIIIPIGSLFLTIRFARNLVEYATGERFDRTEAEEASEG
jgi:C4-dicarboxylate transporter DctQ subunit